MLTFVLAFESKKIKISNENMNFFWNVGEHELYLILKKKSNQNAYELLRFRMYKPGYEGQ